MNDLLIPYEIEFKKNNLWTISFPKKFSIQKYICYETSRPKFIHQNGVWLIDDITIVLRDSIAPSISERLMKLLNGKSFSYVLDILDPTGETVESWDIRDCMVKSIDFGKLSYADDKLTLCTLVVSPTSAKLKNK